MIDDTSEGAKFSACRAYRYTLWRRWEPGCDTRQMVAFIGLNPSTADEAANDPTVTRCINYAKRWGFGGMVMLNIFAYRATDPRAMKLHPSPVGRDNDSALLQVSKAVGKVVCAWGTHGAYDGRGNDVRQMLSGVELSHLGLTKDGFPKHPLYLKSDLEPVRW